jgi:hypothetical protein
VFHAKCDLKAGDLKESEVGGEKMLIPSGRGNEVDNVRDLAKRLKFLAGATRYGSICKCRK